MNIIRGKTKNAKKKLMDMYNLMPTALWTEKMWENTFTRRL